MKRKHLNHDESVLKSRSEERERDKKGGKKSKLKISSG